MKWPQGLVKEVTRLCGWSATYGLSSSEGFMETGGTLVSSSPVMASVGAGFQDETSRTNTTGGSTAKVSKARMKASAGTARQRKEPQTVIGTSTFSEENNKHQQSLAEGTMETIAASVNNNNNVECDSVNEGEATMDKQNKDTKNPSGHSDNDRKVKSKLLFFLIIMMALWVGHSH